MINWQIITLGKVGSTNDEIKKYCTEKGKYVVLRAIKQTSGRGRRGRSWCSIEGNLFFSLALEMPLSKLGMLVVIASLSLHQVIKNLNSQAEVKLKWPNDVLLDGAKVSGMLLEKGPLDYIIVGIGVNIAKHPDNAEMLYPTTSLQEAGIHITAEEFMAQYLQKFEQNMELLQAGKDDILRNQWLKCAKGVGEKIAVRQEEGEQSGIFRGIDENAHLLLEKANEICHIRVGDVFYIEKEA